VAATGRRGATRRRWLLPSPAKVGDFFGLRVQGLAERAVFLLRNEPLRSLGYKTADTLVQAGRFDAVIAYLESLAGDFAG
jgi:hypothetical protein